MTAKQIVLFLAGDRDSILKIAGCRHAVWLGLLFVLSAGFAREYDGEDLLHEPWHLLIPLVASLVTSFLLFAHVWSWSGSRSSRELGFLRGYRSFLGLYWMTAPLAWLYAIPVERFHSAADATRLNLALLGLVSVWRVILMMRIVSVLFERRFRHAIFPVILFADTVAIVLLFFTPLPVISLMGGIRLTESDLLIRNTAYMIGFCGVLSWLIWLAVTAVSFGHPVSVNRKPITNKLFKIDCLGHRLTILAQIQLFPYPVSYRGQVTGLPSQPIANLFPAVNREPVPRHQDLDIQLHQSSQRRFQNRTITVPDRGHDSVND